MKMQTNKPLHYLLCGLPFSGKTTVAYALEKQLGFVRLNIDDVKFAHGFEGVSDDNVPEEAWEKIFAEMDRRLVEYLKQGKSVTNETVWVWKSWRDKPRKVAQEAGFTTKVLFIDVPEQAARERLLVNRKTKKRFDVSDKIFEEAVRDFERPTQDEDVLVYDQTISVDEWIKRTFN
ncbi:ATP-binding protein [Candidatus Gottesmanbacteria bacterium]|nr:ATP-binding protein [Candidatus Gottesmanbacteria bacterium]